MDPFECFVSCLSCDNFSNLQGVTCGIKNKKFHKMSCLADKWIFQSLTRLLANFICIE